MTIALANKFKIPSTTRFPRVRGNIKRGESAHYCDECGDEIPEARRVAMKGVRLCVECQSAIELVSQRQALFNRRASKDSQLR